MILKQNLIDNTLKAFERYKENCDDISIRKVNEQESHLEIECYGHMGETFTLKVWIDGNEELHIENERNENVFDYVEENGWTPEQMKYMKFGFEQH